MTMAVMNETKRQRNGDQKQRPDHPAGRGDDVGCIDGVEDIGKSEGMVPDADPYDVECAICGGLGEFFGTEPEADDGAGT